MSEGIIERSSLCGLSLIPADVCCLSDIAGTRSQMTIPQRILLLWVAYSYWGAWPSRCGEECRGLGPVEIKSKNYEPPPPPLRY